MNTLFHVMVVRNKQSNRLYLRAKFTGESSKRDAESAAHAILSSNPDRFSIDIEHHAEPPKA